MDETSKHLASVYRMTAINFLMSARRLQQSFAAEGKAMELNIFAVPFYYLTSHAAELFLKAALLKNGVTEREVKTFNRRHNLSRLMEDLIEKGAHFNKTSIAILTDLSEQHSKHLLRYNSVRVDEVMFTPNAEAIFAMLQELQLLSGLNMPLRPRPPRRAQRSR